MSTLYTTAEFDGNSFWVDSLFVSSSALLKELTNYSDNKVYKAGVNCALKHFLPSTILDSHSGE